ncbi:MAG: hypothetical protein CMM71_00355 [Rhodospirillaceae bacterium]|nr:hypothetical protein [Rhodospirillaceae bacterium]
MRQHFQKTGVKSYTKHDLDLLRASIGPASDLLGGWLKSKVETKAAETPAEVLKAGAEAEVIKFASTMKLGKKRSWHRVAKIHLKMDGSPSCFPPH